LEEIARLYQAYRDIVINDFDNDDEYIKHLQTTLDTKIWQKFWQVMFI